MKTGFNKIIDVSTDGLKADKLLLLGLIMIMMVSVVVDFSALNENSSAIASHVMKCCLGVAVFLTLSRVNIVYIKQLSLKFYALTVFLLVLVALVGDVRMGARRWIDLGFMSFQPSEFSKFAVIVAVAYVVSQIGLIKNMRTVGLILAIIGVPCLFILKQPDLGTCVLVATSGIAVMFFAGLPFSYIAAAVGGLALASPVIWEFVLMPYQKQRILTVLNPMLDPRGSGYHILQSQAAIGSGGFSGVGWLNGTQVHLGFVPEQHTDFIFAVIGEEFGFVGWLVIATLFAFLISRMFNIMYKIDDIFAKCVIGGIATILFVYVFVNVGMVVGMLPVVGVPLPFLSCGGTATVSMCACLGIVSAYSSQILKKH